MADNTSNMANTISIIALIVSVLSAICAAYYSAWVTQRFNKKNKRNDSIKELLELFYSPLVALLTENATLYNEFGPPRFLGKTPEIANALGEGWNSIRKTVIIPNLQCVRGLIQKYWIQADINNKRYLQELLLHCTAFCEYDNAPNELYHKYKYKLSWISEINQELDKLKEILNK